MKVTVEDQDLRSRIVDYLAMNGTEVPEDTPVSITLPGAGNAPQRCLSGSNLMTAGGKFAPGYDAKLKSALYAIIRGEPNKVPQELTPQSQVATDVVGPMGIALEDWTVEQAEKVLDSFNWPHPTIKVKPEPKAKKSDTDGESNGEDNGEPSTGASTRAGRKRAAAKAREEAAEAEADEDVEETV